MLPQKSLKIILSASLLLALPAPDAEAHFIGPLIPEPLIKIDRALKKLFAFHCADTEPGAVSLLEAAEKGNLEAVKKLIAEGTNLDVRNGDCNSAVWLAAYNGHWEVVNALFEAGARDKLDYGESALERAASFNCFEKDEIKTDVDQKSSKEAQEHVGGILRAILKSKKPNVNAEYSYDRTALIYAAMVDDIEMVRAFADAGANINAREKMRKWTPLMFAIGNDEIVDFLIQAGADVNVKDKSGQTPLIRASNNGHLKEVQALLAAGAKVRGSSGDTALARAVLRGHLEIAEVLLAAGAKPLNLKGSNYYFANFASFGWQTPEAQAAKVVRTLALAGANVNGATDDFGETALMAEAGLGRREVVRALIEVGADVNVKDKFGRTPLIHAMKAETAEAGLEVRLEVVRALIEAGADVNARDEDDRTALFYAREAEIAEALIEAGADVDARDANGLLVYELSNAEIREVLRAAGAEREKTAGETAAEYAEYENRRREIREKRERERRERMKEAKEKKEKKKAEQEKKEKEQKERDRREKERKEREKKNREREEQEKKEREKRAKLEKEKKVKEQERMEKARIEREKKRKEQMKMEEQKRRERNKRNNKKR